MTWKELKQKIEKMSEDQQDLSAIGFGEEIPIRKISFEKFDENLYYNKNWDNSYLESDLTNDEKEEPGTILVAKKNTYYLLF